jgi:DNA-binding LytR/AlgR family response regulator
MKSDIGLKILIIEDDCTLAQDLQEQLLDFGYTIIDTAANSHDALQAFRRRLPDLVLCDIELKDSEQDGIQLAEAFRNIAKVPLIYLTAFADEDTVKRAKATDPAYYLVKPCNKTQLRVAIDLAIDNFINQKEADPRHSLHFQTLPHCALYSAQDFFFVRQGYRHVRVEVGDIRWIEAMGSAVKMVTDAKNIAFSVRLNSFLEQVAHPDIQRTHKSWAVNVRHVIGYHRGQVMVRYKEGVQEVPLRGKYRDDFLDGLPGLRAD